jgi:hypothetical protein
MESYLMYLILIGDRLGDTQLHEHEVQKESQHTRGQIYVYNRLTFKSSSTGYLAHNGWV